MKKAVRWVCSSCGGNYFPDHAQALGYCPGCHGQGSVKNVEVDDAGVVKVAKE